MMHDGDDDDHWPDDGMMMPTMARRCLLSISTKINNYDHRVVDVVVVVVC